MAAADVAAVCLPVARPRPLQNAALGESWAGQLASGPPQWTGHSVHLLRRLAGRQLKTR